MADRTLQEIVNAPPVGWGDEYDIMSVMNHIIDEYYDFGYLSFDEYSGSLIIQRNVIDVQYDHRRGAATSVMSFKGWPFAVVTRAGRELDDIFNIYVIDSNIMDQAVSDYVNVRTETEEFNLDTNIQLAYWEGIEVDLGDKGRKSY